MAQHKEPGEHSERPGGSVARDSHDALPIHRPPHLGANDPHTPHGGGGAIALHNHPSEMDYIKIAIILTTITAVEVVIYYLGWAASVLVPTLLVLSIAKFAIVVGYFMHLKFDDRRFTWIFSAGLVITLSIFLGTAAMFIYHSFDLVKLVREGVG